MVKAISKGITGFPGPRGEEGQQEGQQGGEQSTFVSLESLGDLGKVETLTKFAKDGTLDVNKVVGSYVELEKHIGNSIKVPGKDATVEEVQTYRRKMGVPDDVNGYGVDNSKGQYGDQEIIGDFLKFAHGEGMSKDHVNKSLDWFNKAFIGGLQKKYQDTVEAGTQALKKEWGDDYDKNLQGAQRAVEQLGGPELKDFMNKFPDLGNNPVLVKTFHAAFKLMDEGRYIGDKTRMTTEDVDEKIRNIEADPAYHDRNHPNWQHLRQERDRLYRVKFPPKKA